METLESRLALSVNLSLPLDILQMQTVGQASFSGTQTDIGTVPDIFDGRTETLMRTANIDPAVIDLAFSSQQTLRAFRVYTSAPQHRWKIQTADTLADLNGQVGSYAETVSWTLTSGNEYSAVALAAPDDARYLRLTVERLAGDNYVHIYEFEVIGDVTISELSVSPNSSTVEEFSFTQLEAAGISSAGITYAMTDRASWTSSASEIASVDGHGLVFGAAAGSALIYATVGDLQASSDVTVTPFPEPMLPDLVVSSITAPLSALSNGAIPISWGIRNDGTAPVSGIFQDRIYLSADATVGSDTAYSSFEFQGTILPGQTISRTQNITLPASIEGNYYVVVKTDANNQISEKFGREENNTAIDDQFIDIDLAPFPNLVIDEVIAPATANSGQQAVVEWIVSNDGNGPTNVPSWYDNVYLSLDQTLDGFDRFLGSVANPSFLDVNDSYRSSLTCTLPDGIDDNYYFIIVTDAGHQVLELGAENDNAMVGGPTDVMLTLPPDLQVSQTQAPAVAFSGQTINVNWTVTNQGMGVTRQSSWFDRVYMSSNATIDGSDHLLATMSHNGALNPNESYDASATLALPIGISGLFYFLVQTDAGNHVFEHVFENNNVGFDAERTDVRLTPPPDLEVELVDAPPAGIASRSLTVAYRVGNNGSTATPNSSWQDRLYLSADRALDASDRLLQSKNRIGILETGETYNDSFTVLVPDDAIGTFYAIVATDAGNVVFELNNDNNVSSDPTPIVISSLPADLVVGAISGPSSAEAGNSILVEWTVSNNGVGDTVVGTWFDRLYLSADNSISSDDVVLATVRHDGVLDPSKAYSITNQLATIPYEVAPGNYSLLLATDYDNRVYEGADNGNNSSVAAPIIITREESDLQVTTVSGSATAISGGQLAVNWTVENVSPVATNATYWYDNVYLSADNTIDASDRLLGSVQHTNSLLSNGTYSVARNFTLPRDLVGEFFVIVRTDATNRVIEGAFEGNNDRSTPGSGAIELSAVPDLTIVSVNAPTSATSGQPIEISWTIQNIGAASATGSWFDAVYLSLDQVFDRSTDTYLGFANRPLELTTGTSYSQTATFNIPAGVAGTYWVFVVADSSDRVFERGAELNNFGYDATSVLVSLLPPADFVVGTITVPVNGVSGQTATITYTVENQGQNAARGTWVDSVYLSADDQWDINDAILGRVTNANADVAGGSSYTRTLTEPLPGVVPGDYHVIIRSDILNRIPESNDRNNIGVSLDQASIDFAELELGAPAMGSLSEGRAAYYKVSVPAGETLVLELDGANSSGFSELYASLGQLPSRSQSDFSSIQPFQPDQRIVIPSTQAGTYYILIYGNDVPVESAAFSIQARTVQFAVFDTSFGRGGTAGDRTIEVNGAKFDRTVTATLVGLGVELPAEANYFENDTQYYATFDLQRVPAGLYDVVIRRGDGETVTVAEGFEVVNTIESPIIVPYVDSPQRVRRSTDYSFSVHWANDSLNDAIAPLLVVGNTVAFGRNPGSVELGNVYSFYGANSHSGPAGIIRPGQSETLTFYSHSDGLAGIHTVYVDRQGKDPSETFDWESRRSSIFRPGVTEADNASLFMAVQQRVGSTWGDYLQMLSRNATNLPDAVGNSRSETDLLQIEVDYALATIKPHISGQLVSVATSELPASLTAYQADTGKAYTTTVLRDGSFVFPWIDPGMYQLRSANGIVSTSSPIIVTGTATANNVAASFSLGATLSISLVPPVGTSVGSAPSFVMVIGENESSGIGVQVDSTHYEVRHLDEGTYEVLIDVSGFGRARLNVTIADGSLAQDITVPLQQESTISGSVRIDGAIPSIPVGVLARRVGGDELDTFVAEVQQGAFRVTGVAAGTYEVSLIAPGTTGVRQTISVAVGEEVTIDTVDLSTTSGAGLGAMYGAAGGGGAASDSHDPETEEDLNHTEKWLKRILIPLEYLLFGSDVAGMWLDFLDSTPMSPAPGRAFTDGDHVVEAFGLFPGFRRVSQTEDEFNKLMDLVAMRLQAQFDSGELTCDEFNSNNERSFALSEIVPEENLRKPRIDYSNALTIPGNLAGRAGDWLGTDDIREFGGDIFVRIVGKNQLEIESRMTFFLQDGVDFEPGNTDQLVFYEHVFVSGLDLLENYGHAFGVPFTVSFNDLPGRTKSIMIPTQDCCDDMSDCDPCKSEDPPDDCDEIERPAAVDPNDILGPLGFGPERWIASSAPVQYTIRFENDPLLATSPAQHVRVNQLLDGDLDRRTFRLEDFGFGDTFVDVPENRTFFQTRIDLVAQRGIYVDVIAGIDVATGEAFWEFTSIDPLTGELPADPAIGFLPPNLAGPEGEGFVTYSIRPITTIQTGDVIDAEARIVFDVNEPIDTPAIFNTVDAGNPVSVVTAFSPIPDGAVFDVSWTGSDDGGGSGLADFTIYVSENGGPFSIWLANSTLLSAQYVGQAGKQYEFYSVARDNAGNVEPAPTTADALIVTPGPAPQVTDVLIQSGLTQRSFVDGFVINFSNEVTLADLIASGSITSAITLTNLGVDADSDLDQLISLTPQQFRYEFDRSLGISRLVWSHDAFASPHTSLADGFYHVTLDSTLITDLINQGLDGNADGVGGDDYSFTFHRLLGDANGDRTVNATDMQLVNSALGSRPNVGTWNVNTDLDRDNIITTRDRIVVSRATGNSIVPPTVTEGLAGDYNRDRSVDAADYVVWRKQLGAAGPGLAADGDGNSIVDGDDLLIWRSNYGQTLQLVESQSSSIIVNVPPERFAATAVVDTEAAESVREPILDITQETSVRAESIDQALAQNDFPIKAAKRSVPLLSLELLDHSNGFWRHGESNLRMSTRKSDVLSEFDPTVLSSLLLMDGDARQIGATHDSAFTELFSTSNINPDHSEHSTVQNFKKSRGLTARLRHAMKVKL